MIGQKTCLVLGAGASVPYGLPTGPVLRQMIIERAAKPNDKLQAVLQQAGFPRERVQEFVEAFAASRQPSVDTFLAHREDLSRVGKAAIAAALIHHENPVNLLQPPQEDDDWFQLLWLSLQSGGKDGFAENNLSVVTFNYDRSFQRLLVDAYRHSFGVMEQEAFERVFDAVPIVQVHGSLGLLALEPGRPGARNYSPTLERSTVQVAAEGIIVLSEGDSTSEEFSKARRFVRDAERIILLGCAYHQENMERIGLRASHGITIQGSAYGLTDRERQLVQKSWGVATGDRSWRSRAFLRERVDLMQ